MKRRSGPQQIGERYLLQFPGGVERVAEVVPGGDPGQAVLRPLAFEDPLPAHVLPGGEWLLEGGERIVRDWAGAYWSVRALTAGVRRLEPGEVPFACVIVFSRYAPPGVLLSYRAASIDWPDQLSDDRLVGLLRRAWETLETDGDERRRRSNGKRSLISDL